MRSRISEFHQKDNNQYTFIQELPKRKASQVAVTKHTAKKAKTEQNSNSSSNSSSDNSLDDEEVSLVFTSNDSAANWSLE